MAFDWQYIPVCLERIMIECLDLEVSLLLGRKRFYSQSHFCGF